MTLSILIPVYNEKATLEELLRRLSAVKFLGVKKEIIIVDDGSTDGTRQIIKKLESKRQYKIFYHRRNQGKGAAVRTAIGKATGDYLLIQDADLEYDPNDIPRLLKPVLAGQTRVVYGSRFQGDCRRMLFLYKLGNKFFTFLVNLLCGANLTDMGGCYKLFSREALKKITLCENRFNFDPEITIKLLKNGEKILEVPSRYSARRFEEGKKISWKDGFRFFWVIIKYRYFD